MLVRHAPRAAPFLVRGSPPEARRRALPSLAAAAVAALLLVGSLALLARP